MEEWNYGIPIWHHMSHITEAMGSISNNLNGQKFFNAQISIAPIYIFLHSGPLYTMISSDRFRTQCNNLNIEAVIGIQNNIRLLQTIICSKITS